MNIADVRLGDLKEFPLVLQVIINEGFDERSLNAEGYRNIEDYFLGRSKFNASVIGWRGHRVGQREPYLHGFVFSLLKEAFKNCISYIRLSVLGGHHKVLKSLISGQKTFMLKNFPSKDRKSSCQNWVTNFWEKVVVVDVTPFHMRNFLKSKY